jgi:hypothetical protein
MSIGGIGSAGITTVRDIEEIVVNIDGGGSVIATGALNRFYAISWAGTISGWYLTGNPSGSIVIDVWRKNGANPSVADTITTSKPTLSGATFAKVDPINPAQWSVNCVPGDVFGFNVDSASGVTSAVLTIQITRN